MFLFRFTDPLFPLTDKPPEISPRREFLQKKEPPIPPPRPSKAAELLQRKLDSLKREQKATVSEPEKPREPPSTPKQSNPIEVKPETGGDKKSAPKDIPVQKHFLEERFEGLELLTPNNSKTLTLKKKNSIFAKRRKIALKALEISDIQGHLFRRTKDKNGVSYWAKLYFIMVESALYGFRDKQSAKANCLIFLSGFTVSLAKEVHSKPFAYKVYHPKKTFYFAAETEQALSQWMEYIKRATLKGSVAPLDPAYHVETRELYSETDSSDDEVSKDLTNSPLTLKGDSHPKHEKTSSPSSGGKNEKYHLSFGTIKKFTHSLPFTSSRSDKEKEREDKKKASSDTPVPTAQFRSYRKIHGNAGMQLGAVDFMSFSKSTKTLPPLKASPLPTKSLKISSPLQMLPSHASHHRLHDELPSLDAAPSELASLSPAHFSRSTQLAKTKTLPFNYMHASNPNLVEFTFQASKALDYSQPKVNPSNNFDAQHNLQGFITLKDLMLKNEEAEAHNMYANRVNLGVEKPSDRHQMKADKSRSEAQPARAEERDVGVEKIQRRTLPKTPDYAQSFKTDDNDIILARSKEGQKLRDFGYEFISGDDANASMHQQQYLVYNPHHRSPVTAKAKPSDRGATASTKRRGLGWIVKGKVTDSSSEARPRPDSSASHKFSFHSQQSAAAEPPGESKKCASAGLYKLERSQSSAATMSEHLDPLSSSRERRSSVDRNGAYFSKLSFPSTKPAKERRLLGSPLLHRAIFGRKQDQSIDHEPFSPIENNQKAVAAPREQITCSATIHSFKGDQSPSPISITKDNDLSDSNIEYPPVFEAETYSLHDPNMSLLRRRNVNDKK